MAKRGRKKKHLFPVLRLKPETIKTIFFIIFIVLSIFTLFSFLQSGPLLTNINIKLTEYFGLISVFVPFLLLLTSFLFAKIKIPLKELNVFFGSLIMFISLLGLLKQGTIGLFFSNQVTILTGELPSFFIFFFSGIAGFVILFDTNIGQIVKFFINIFKALKKYTIGNSKNRKEKPQKDVGKFLSELSPFKSEKETKEKDDPNVVNVPPVMKSPNQLPLSSSSPLQSLSNNQIWEYPPLSIFDSTPGAKADRGDVRYNANTIEKTLESFGIRAKVVEYNNSPSVTQYALEVALGTKLAKIISLSNDLAMALSAPGGQIRIEAPIPGRSLVGIEVPNKTLEVVPIRKIIESDAMKNAKNKITVPLGLDVAGNPRVADITKMPHVLIAGQTGSGKSVCVNSWIANILFRASPQEVRMIMVDPKRVELTPYNGIPHLLTPVIVDPEKVISALKWAVAEMERRYKTFTEVGAKNIESYNNLSGFQSMPYILIFIDELAEIMLFSPSEVEDNVCRIAQMARAVGIHLILATQRPSVNVITGLIKANIPTRISFAVTSVTDSRVILDTPGAEKLLGRGDMLYIPPDLAKPVRIQGCFVSDKELVALIDFLKNQKATEYNDEITNQPVSAGNGKSTMVSTDGGPHDPLYDSAVKLIQDTGKASTTYLQRKLSVGYARAAKILDEIESAGLIGPSNGAKARDILMPHNQGEGSVE
ncbi:MAG: DNA translocase FtsK [Candidatus Shapirobacteria bacterium]|nr:DNA translocase FtsK [Candidatus Shapirobacteria bacterium]MDD4410744.1 DNA translocase FtsK [Candidatus Shapirobacteria bacterium]